ncbi:hypothetical protein K492DRAFT_186464 [Lichtheimia hyalospora FSU 10163]|nr:hypothetical protein K492DRAFT_186464 [Lichtheimia hyalospora FSU 10163]
MKFTSLLSAVMVFGLSAVNAEREEAVLRRLILPSVSPPDYRFAVYLEHIGYRYDIILRTKDRHFGEFFTEESRGIVEYDPPPIGEVEAVINDNYANGSDEKTFRIDLEGPGAEFHFEGTSVIRESIDNLTAHGQIF